MKLLLIPAVIVFAYAQLYVAWWNEDLMSRRELDLQLAKIDSDHRARRAEIIKRFHLTEWGTCVEKNGEYKMTYRKLPDI